MKPFKLLFPFALFLLLMQSCKTSESVVDLGELIQLDTIEIKAYSDLDIYRAAEPRKFDLLHSKLEVEFDWEKSQLNGKASLSLTPYFYAQDTLVLDAKGFDIHRVAQLDSIGKKWNLLYSYDSSKLYLYFENILKREDTVQVFIEYTAKPNALTSGGSEAITNDIGLYFINPTEEDPKKPRQVWTQGETQANSCWFPTLDVPNEKMTQEVFITVDSNFSTLSNGSLEFQTENQNGTRTDYWRQDLPHAPYLTMMAVGEYAIVKDEWRGKGVNYYVEPEYEEYARQIFPNTLEMLEFFSNKLNYEYPWVKYDQVVVRDYVSGAMENTTAVIYGEFMQGDARYLIDNAEEAIVAHELFHHWFGDLVTCESWSNITLNEAFATYGEFLWNEHKYGKDAAEYGLYVDYRAYLQEARTEKKDLIRFHYLDRDDVFDAHSYQKGGRIVHMLRNFLGDDAFFEGLNHYLKKHEFQSVEVHDLRLAMEEVSGMDLNWFFNQWFLSAGHPIIEVNKSYQAESNELVVNIKQTQNGEGVPSVFELYTDLEVVWNDGQKRAFPIHIQKRDQSFTIPMDTEPSLVKLDAENIHLAQIDQDINAREAIVLFQLGGNYLDRYSALEFLSRKSDSVYLDIIESALSDPFWNIRRLAIRNMEKLALLRPSQSLEKLKQMAALDSDSRVRSEAYETIVDLFEEQVTAVDFKKGLSDSSYVVVSSALWGTYMKDPEIGIEAAEIMQNIENVDIQIALSSIFSDDGNPKYEPYLRNLVGSLSSFNKYPVLVGYGAFLSEQSPEIQSSAVVFLSQVSQEEELWWIRMAGINTLERLKEEAKNRIAQLEEEMPAEDEAADPVLSEKIRVQQKLIDSINAELEAMLEIETEINLLRMIKTALNS